MRVTTGRAMIALMDKRTGTKEAILEKALDMTSELGLEGLSLGGLAKRVGMSKSGLFAHFGSKEDLQTETLDAAAERFVEMVVQKAIKKPRGLPRMEELFRLWLEWSSSEHSAGCPFVAASTEFDDRPGPVRAKLVEHFERGTETITKAAVICVEEGHFREDLDCRQFAFEFWAIVLSHHQFSRLMRQKDARKRAKIAFSRLVRDSSQM